MRDLRESKEERYRKESHSNSSSKMDGKYSLAGRSSLRNQFNRERNYQVQEYPDGTRVKIYNDGRRKEYSSDPSRSPNAKRPSPPRYKKADPMKICEPPPDFSYLQTGQAHPLSPSRDGQGQPDPTTSYKEIVGEILDMFTVYGVNFNFHCLRSI